MDIEVRKKFIVYGGGAMGIYYWILLIIAILYGGLTIFAGVLQFKEKKINLLSGFAMIIGGLLIIVSSIKVNVFGQFTIFVLILGLLLIHFSAINNGFKLYGKLNIKHHIVRFIISILIIIIFLLR